ncbi:Nif3-like dinuclear metal center hexameric protein [bacterium]|nr:Nif3-like dinuclear metal center hexameric protein [bacterium]
MEIQVRDIIKQMDEWAPQELAAAWDNVGLQIGDVEWPVKSVLVALDVDAACLEQVASNKYDLVITHHPLFFNSIRSIDLRTDIGRIVWTFIKSNTALFSAHTNLDVVPDGVNDTLCKAYGFEPKTGEAFDKGFGKWFECSERRLSDLESIMPCRVAGAKTIDNINRVGFCGGSGKSIIQELPNKGINVFITGEVGYHDEVFCELNGIVLILLGHKESEDPVLPVIKERLLAQFPGIQIDVI